MVWSSPGGDAVDLGGVVDDPRDRFQRVADLGAERDPRDRHRRSAEPRGAENQVGYQPQGLADALDHVGGAAHGQRRIGEILVLDLTIDQAARTGVDEPVGVDEVRLADGLARLQRLDLPVGIAPLVFLRLQGDRQQLELLTGAQGGEKFGVALFEGGHQRAAELLGPGRVLLRLLDQGHEPVRARQVAPVTLVGAGVVFAAPALAQRAVPEIRRLAIVPQTARVDGGVDEREPVVDQVVDLEQPGIQRREAGREAADGRRRGWRAKPHLAGTPAENHPHGVEDHARLLEGFRRAAAPQRVGPFRHGLQVVQQHRTVAGLRAGDVGAVTAGTQRVAASVFVAFDPRAVLLQGIEGQAIPSERGFEPAARSQRARYRQGRREGRQGYQVRPRREEREVRVGGQ